MNDATIVLIKPRSASQTTKMVVPRFVKWAGGKQQLLEQFKPLFPKQFNRYFEPFVGSGAVTFFIAQTHPKKSIFISDVNKELIEAFEMVRDNPTALIEVLKKHKKAHSKTHYYQTRALDPVKLPKTARVARFIYLNRTCFNGLHRLNSKGEFNVPMGSYKNPDIAQETTIRKAAELLQNVRMRPMPFHEIVEHANKGDFIYFDPPYHPLTKKPSFTKYSKNDFLETDQKLLAEVFRKLDKKGCLCMLSNSDTEFIRDLYRGYNIHTVKARRMINSNVNGRGAINEVVVVNYPTNV